VPGGGQVQLFLHHSRLDTRHVPFGININDPGHVLREVHHDRPPDRLASQAGARTPGQHRNAELGGRGQHRGHVVSVAREDHPDRLDRVHARVAREQVSGVRVEPDLTTDHAA